MNIVFVTWDGPGTAYHENLFIPLLDGATDDGDHVHLLQFHWGSEQRAHRIDALARQLGMTYDGRDVRATGGRLAVFARVARGISTIRRMRCSRGCDVLLVRSVIPAAMALAALIGRRRSSTPALIYDADGLPADERAEFAGWNRRGIRYRLFRLLEWAAVRRADVVLTRTHAAARLLSQRTSRDEDAFAVVTNGRVSPDAKMLSPESRAQTRRALGIPDDSPLLVYAGSIGPQYRPEQMLQIAATTTALRPESWLAIFTADHNHERVRALAADFGVERVVVRSLAPEDVAAHLAAADVGLALRSPTLSQRGVAPVKVAEYLLSGLPIVYTRGIGDLDAQLRDAPALAVDEHCSDPAAVARWILETVLRERDTLRDNARTHGVAHFSLERGAADYRAAFDRLAATAGGSSSADRNGSSQRS